jgi:hypothetical protein
MPSISLDSMDDVMNFNPQPLKKKPMLIYIYMTGCPFCEQMKPNWNSFKSRESHPDLNILDINQAILPSLVKLHPSMKPQVSNTFSFPDITLHSNQNKYKYQGDRSVPSFEEMVSTVLAEESKDKKKSDKPKDGKKSDKPKDGKKSDKPKDGKKSDKPKDGKKSDKPKTGKKPSKSKDKA